jgi:probable phosphoglycerate mutase
MELLLIRHALPIRRELVEGRADPELSVAGHRQAEHLAEYLAEEHLDAIYASPLRRARQTAEPLARLHGLDVVIEDGVAEYDRDSNEYVPMEELKASGDPRWHAMLAGEWGNPDVPRHIWEDNVVTTVERLVAGHGGQKIAIVCHGGVLTAYLGWVLKVPDSQNMFYPNYTSIHRVAAARSGERSILTINETAHLRGTGLHIGLFKG